jgi:hypothetical protein
MLRQRVTDRFGQEGQQVRQLASDESDVEIHGKRYVLHRRRAYYAYCTSLRRLRLVTGFEGRMEAGWVSRFAQTHSRSGDGNFEHFGC